ncbi:MAG TPA: iron-containing alcohol dehydrogenase [Gaiellaceae bacterium]|nr:iron-containing alcohol dehydrogenase [Gaiellaceae bacterium]
MIVRWGLGTLPAAAAEAGVFSPFVVASPRWDGLELGLGSHGRWRETPSDRLAEAAALAEGADGILAVGGGSAIDLGKAISAGTGLPLVSLPTTYSGAEWTTYFGVRDPERRMRGGGAGAHPAAIVYEPELTLDLPRETTVGTALNALAHCAEALYADGHNPAADEEALAGARLISEWLPRVVESPRDLEARTELLRGACHGGAALAGSMLALAHALAQAIGGAYGLPHGTLNGICLPPVLRFNARVAPDAVRRFGEAIGAPDDPGARVEELCALGGATRLRDLGVPEHDVPELAGSAARRGGNLANPHQASPEEIELLLREVW